MSLNNKFIKTKRSSSTSNVNCCVYNCESVAKKNPELSFHRFPKAGVKVQIKDCFGNECLQDRRQSWVVSLKMGKKISDYMTVCSKHFKEDDFITPNSG